MAPLSSALALVIVTSACTTIPGMPQEGGGAQFTLATADHVQAATERMHDRFREELQACDRELSRHVDWSLLDVINGVDGAPEFSRTDVLHPVLFAISTALTTLWRMRVGIEPEGIVEAVFETTDYDEHARAAHADYLVQHGVSAATFPLLKLDLALSTQGKPPFSLAAPSKEEL